jgi:hypothetical protein
MARLSLSLVEELFLLLFMFLKFLMFLILP